MIATNPLPRLVAGSRRLARAVGITLGPFGRGVVLGRGSGDVQVSIDGWTVAKEIELADPVEQIGCQYIRESAEEVAARAGDGTTTAILLANAILRSGYRRIAAGERPRSVIAAIDADTETLVAAIQRQAEYLSADATGVDRLRKVVRQSARQDDLAGMVLEAIEAADTNGVVEVRAGRGATRVVVQTAGRIRVRPVSPRLAMPGGRMVRPLIVVAEFMDRFPPEWAAVFEKLRASGRPILVFGRTIRERAISGIAANRVRGLDVALYRLDYAESEWRHAANAIYAMTGAGLIADRQSITVDHAGEAEGVWEVEDDWVQIAPAAASIDRMTGYLGEMRQKAESSAPEVRQTWWRRMALVGAKIAAIEISEATIQAESDRRRRAEDGVQAARRTIEGGLVPGGGGGLWWASKSLPPTSVVGAAATIITRVIAKNAGLPSPPPPESLSAYDVVHGWVDRSLAAGPYDPTDVVVTAVRYASAAATVLLDSDAIVWPTRKGA